MSTTLPPTPWKNDDWSDATLQQIAEYMSQHLPEDWSIEAFFENGAFSFRVTINDADGMIHYVSDLLDYEPALPNEQLRVAFEFAMKYGSQEAS